MSWRKLLSQAHDKAEDRDDFVERVKQGFDKYGFVIALQSKCWCEGKATGPEHTPGCAGIEQDRLLDLLL